MKEPFGLFWIIGIFATLHISIVIHWSRLGLTTTEHAQNGQTNGLSGQGGRPFVSKNGKTNVTIAVNVRMLGYVVADEHDRGRVERVSLWKLELQPVLFSIVQSALSASEVNYPYGHITLDGIPVYAHSRHRILHEIGQLLVKSL